MEVLVFLGVLFGTFFLFGALALIPLFGSMMGGLALVVPIPAAIAYYIWSESRPYCKGCGKRQ